MAKAPSKEPFKHKSFKRSYREDYQRELKAPGLFAHTVDTLKLLFRHWRLFGGLLLVVALLCFTLVGAMSEGAYTRFQDLLAGSGDLGRFASSAVLLFSAITSGGFNGGLSETQVTFAIVIALIAWLVTIYLLRAILAGQAPRLRDGLFNALGPLLSTLIIAIIAIIDLLPIGLFMIVLSAAIQTNFLSTPATALLFLGFSALMFLISLYLLSGALLALVAVSAPGMYPLAALQTTRELIAGRRIRFITRLLFGIFAIAAAVCVIMIPLIFLDLTLKSALPALAGVPFIPFCFLIIISAIFIYFPAYIYLYYRRLLDND